MQVLFKPADISKKEFKLFRNLILEEFGISLNESKSALVQSRLAKWVIALNFSSYTELYEHFCNDSSELILLADAISTNVTYFFREEKQWEYLKGYISSLKQNSKNKKIRIWSAGCSSGQEPYSIALFLIENIPDFVNWDIKILATDLSEAILRQASKGEYQAKDIKGLPKIYINKYFSKSKNKRGELLYQINDEIKQMILFRSFNLVTGNYQIFKNPFDIIFCRNVMIYFNNKTQQQVIKNFIRIMMRGSVLLIGHSESITHTKMPVKLITHSIYAKK
ncbi:MAG: protein-glutamate O-methyltransferase CheR [Pseudomonadota bacterium]